jgi:hypothetical protein
MKLFNLIYSSFKSKNKGYENFLISPDSNSYSIKSLPVSEPQIEIIGTLYLLNNGTKFSQFFIWRRR